MKAHLKWARGGEAEVVAISNDAVKLVSSVPWPPGARVVAEVAGGQDATAATVTIKVHGSKKLDAGGFAIEGRPLDLKRELRELLESLARG